MRLLITLLFLIIANLCVAQKKSDLTDFPGKARYNGRVKKVTETRDNIHSHTTDPDFHNSPLTIYYVNTSGNYDSIIDGPVKKIFVYSKSGLLSRIIVSSRNEPADSSWNEFYYDEKNRLAKEIEVSLMLYKYIHLFNEKGDIIETDTYVFDSTMLKKMNLPMFYSPDVEHIENKYDPNGSLIEKKHYPNDSLHEIYTYQYDANGNRIETKELSADGHIQSKDTFAFFKSGYIHQSFDYKKTGSLNSYTASTFDKRGFQKSMVFDMNNSYHRKATYSYKYDAKGNWVEKIVHSNFGKITYTRAIEYY